MKPILTTHRDWVEGSKVELVERKGLGHPDSMADGMAEEFSRSLCLYYMDNFGGILHHNVDKLDVVGGAANPHFGGGKVLKPITIFFSGRATTKIGNQRVPIENMTKDVVKNFIKKTFRFLDLKDINMLVKTKGGSTDLTGVFKVSSMPLAGDTSLGCGYYPLSPLEKMVLGTEQLINSDRMKKRYPFIGEDVKVMGVRQEGKKELIIACAFVSKFLKNKDDYMGAKEKLHKAVDDFVFKKFGDGTKVFINTADRPENNVFYLTVTGTSAESGDDGAVGRGNRVNGLITPFRPMVMEAASGKNPRNHVGKIYNVLAKRLAENVFLETGLLNNVFILSRIGQPINDPEVINVSTYGKRTPSADSKIRGEIARCLENIEDITECFLKGKEKCY